ncbi:MAG: D-glycero-beta-D-manno-heptose 1,7-bisphosphate 7-phosphatase [Planctomycetota bacterium]
MTDRPAVFLDRDGTIVREVDYLSDPDQLELLDGAAEAMRRLRDAGYLLCIVTNQSGVARGLFDERGLAEIHDRLRTMLAEVGVELDWIGYCPYHDKEGAPAYRADSSCRKPRPGMLVEAAATLGIALERSWCIGDSLRDVEAGSRVGVPGLLVRTGKGRDEEERARRSGRHVEVVDDLAAAAASILFA